MKAYGDKPGNVDKLSGLGDTPSYYLYDLCRIVRDDAFEAKRRLEAASGENHDTLWGILHGYCRVISLMQQQAEVFEIPVEYLGLKGLDPENDLN